MYLTMQQDQHPLRRIKLVFMGDLSTSILKLHHYTQCWYLISSKYRYVGDLAQGLLIEYDLHNVLSLKLTLDHFVLPLTASIEMIRDNDTVHVQIDPLRRKQIQGTLVLPPNETKLLQGKERSRKRKEQKVEFPEARPKNKKRKGSALELEDEGKRSAKKSRKKDTAKKQTIKPHSSPKDKKEENRKVENVQISKPNIEKVPEIPAKARKEKRKAKKKAPKRRTKDATIPEVTTEKNAPTDNQLCNKPVKASIASKGHVRFGADSENEDEAEVVQHPTPLKLNLRPKYDSRYISKHPENLCNGNRPKQVHSKEHFDPKYGPLPAAKQSVEQSTEVNENENEPYFDGIEIWKRPYEVIANMNEEKPVMKAQKACAKEEAINKGKAVDIQHIGQNDIIAYRILRLCEETWTPIVSDFEVAEVIEKDSDSLHVFPQTFKPTTTSGFPWTKAFLGEEEIIQISSIQELRVLHGPSRKSLEEEDSSESTDRFKALIETCPAGNVDHTNVGL